MVACLAAVPYYKVPTLGSLSINEVLRQLIRVGVERKMAILKKEGKQQENVKVTITYNKFIT